MAQKKKYGQGQSGKVSTQPVPEVSTPKTPKPTTAPGASIDPGTGTPRPSNGQAAPRNYNVKGVPDSNNSGTGTMPGSNPVTGQPVERRPYDGKTVTGQPVESSPYDGKTVTGQPVESGPVPGQPAQGANPAASYLLTLPGLSDGTKQALGNLINNGYQPSQAVTDALGELNKVISNQPAAFQSQYFDQLNNVMNSILGREAFSYDLTSDPMYQQYRDQYMQSGQQAMQDTMGQAAAMTGGYGSSYATTAGNQAYQQHLGQLNEMAPQLYQMALQQYQMTGDQMQQQYQMLNDMYQTEYGQYNDQYNRWLSERDFAYNRYGDERDYGYGQYRDQIGDWRDIAGWERDQYNTDREYDYRKENDEYNRQIDEREFNYRKENDEYNRQIDEREFNYRKERDEYNRQIDEREYDYRKENDEYNRQIADRDYYFNYAMQMIQAGKMPSDDLLDRLGLSEDDIRKLRKYYKNQNKSSKSSSSSSSSSKEPKSEPDPIEEMTPEEYADYIAWFKRQNQGGYNGSVPTYR